MRGDTEMAMNLQDEMRDLSQGTMVNMYEVHVRDDGSFTPELVEDLKTRVSAKLGFDDVVDLDPTMDFDKYSDVPSGERLQVVNQDESVCFFSKDL
jgi:hypothetical protein